ncbi:MAG: hypothetical protein KGJ09_09505 [Candidatus Omnitrophica bacterium]|nr:hypothetical protein [Candidatus Omnitrophota bacterium]MDE2214745.1 hypothetical protein [Candidatus Omnitrophota bacterium]MDE2231772.1 hypothetical protein [Candidatus Omnitrophota bacterium]
MRLILVLLIFSGVAVMPAGAQEGVAGTGVIVSRIQTKLNLTQDQTDAVAPIVEKYAVQRRQLRQNMRAKTINRAACARQLKQLKVNERMELSQVLSNNQLRRWDSLQTRADKHAYQGERREVNGTSG